MVKWVFSEMWSDSSTLYHGNGCAVRAVSTHYQRQGSKLSLIMNLRTNEKGTKYALPNYDVIQWELCNVGFVT